MHDYISSPDDQFDHFINVGLAPAGNVAGNPLQLTPSRISLFNTAQTAWTAAYATKPVFDTALAGKDAARAVLDAAAMPFLATETKMPHRNDFAAAEAGHTAYYAARWVNTKARAGPWSTITGYLVN